MTHDYCLNCQWADVYISRDAVRVFCQKRMKVVDITEAFDCMDFKQKEPKLETKL